MPAVIDVVAKPSTFHRKFIGNSNGISYIPAEFLNFNGSTMTFTERFINFIAISVENSISYWADYYWHEPHYNKHFPNDKYPSFHDARKNISLVLMNNHFSQGSIEANLPGMIEVGGMHIKAKPEPLPKVYIFVIPVATIL